MAITNHIGMILCLISKSRCPMTESHSILRRLGNILRGDTRGLLDRWFSKACYTCLFDSQQPPQGNLFKQGLALRPLDLALRPLDLALPQKGRNMSGLPQTYFWEWLTSNPLQSKLKHAPSNAPVAAIVIHHAKSPWVGNGTASLAWTLVSFFLEGGYSQNPFGLLRPFFSRRGEKAKEGPQESRFGPRRPFLLHRIPKKGPLLLFFLFVSVCASMAPRCGLRKSMSLPPKTSDARILLQLADLDEDSGADFDDPGPLKGNQRQVVTQ